MTPREWTFCAHPSFRVLVLRLPAERGLEDHRSCSVSPWSLAQNAICFQRPFDQFLWGRDPFYCCPRSHSGTNKRLINKSGFSQLEMRVWREEKPSPLACTRAALQEGGLTKRSVLMAGVPRAGAAWWVLGVLSSRVPLGELSSRVPLGALSFRVPLGVPSSWVPRLVVAERSLLGINPLMVAPLRLLHPNLITSRSPHLHIPSHQRLRLQHMNFEGTQPCRQQPGALLSTWCPLRV